MTSLRAKADAVEAATASTVTCSPATLVALKELLLLTEPHAITTKSKTAGRVTKSATTRTKPTASQEQLSSRDRTVLATHVINVTLKSLSEISKPTVPTTPSKPNSDDLRQAAGGKRTLRRSTSAPLSPLQPRQLNRVATSPNLVAQAAKEASPSHSTGCLATVECARAAFAALRALKGPIQPGQADFQIETGMSALVGKLITLGLHDQAIKELHTIKRRFDAAVSTEVKSAKSEQATTISVASLLEFRTPLLPESLTTVIGCQLQVLKLVAATKKPAHITAMLPLLRESHPSSPFNLLVQLAKVGGKEAGKAARQMATASQAVLSLAPSVSSQEDATAMEARLSPSPLVAFELQSIAFMSQLKWWKLARHQGNIENDILSPFARCLRAFARRHSTDDPLVYSTAASAFKSIQKLAHAYGHELSSLPSSPAFAIRQLLGSAAHTAKQYNDAFDCFSAMKAELEAADDKSVRYASVCARLLASILRTGRNPDIVGELTRTVIDGLDGSLSGTATDLNELLDALSLARRSVVGELMNINEGNPSVTSASENLPVLLKGFITRYPRFVRRWLGNSPGKEASAKHILQFDQRRQTIMKSLNQTLDATLMVLKNDISASKSGWQQLDEILQHCSSLLGAIFDPSMSIAKTEQLGAYYVKISSLYFSAFLQYRKQTERTKETNKQMLQALNRSIDAIKDRSAAEKERAQLSTKLEVFADLCKSAGRTEDAVRTLRSICTEMAESGTMQDVVSILSTRSSVVAWSSSSKASLLSRTLRSLAKLDTSWNDWTFFLPEAERAAVLEHLVYLSAAVGVDASTPLKLHDTNLRALLRIYSLDKYPIRRLRVLLHVYFQNLGEEEIDDIAEQVDMAFKQSQSNEQAEDKSLVTYVPHLQTYRRCIQTMAETDCTSLSTLSDAISTWEEMVQACKSKDDLLRVIDDNDEWLSYLKSLVQLAGLRGDDHLQLRASRLLVTASELCSLQDQENDAHMMQQTQFALQNINVGFYGRALDILNEIEANMESRKRSSLAILGFYLCQAEYHTGVGAHDESLDYLNKAQRICDESSMTWAESKAQATLMRSMTHILRSTASLHMGNLQEALHSGKEGVRMLSHDWSKLEGALSAANQDTSESNTSVSSVALKDTQQLTAGPRFWTLASPLIRSLIQISGVYAHVGMLQETLHYAESAAKIAQSTQSSAYGAQVSAWIGNIYLRAGKLDKATLSFDDVAARLPEQNSSLRILLAHKLGDFYSEAGNGVKAIELYSIAEDSSRLLNGEKASEESQEFVKTAKPAARGTRKAAATTSRAPRRTTAATKTKAAPKTSNALTSKDIYQGSLLASIILSRANALVKQKEWSEAMNMMERLVDLPKLFDCASQEQIITAISLIGQSMDQIISDPVFSVVQDSTISFPAVARIAEKAASDISESPVKRGRAATGRKTPAKAQLSPAFAESLSQAQDLLLEAHAAAMTKSDSSMLRRISALLQNTIILLSATNSAKTKALAQSTMGTVAVDLAHNVTWKREQNVLASLKGSELSSKDQGSRRASMARVADAARFQKSYVDTIPKAWSVVSVSLSENRHDLCITKFQAGHSPFILRLPLERANSRDADSEVFSFEHGKEELLDIIKLANETSHSARDFSIKEERNAWWAEREALDTRLKDLLVTIETTWLGGFKGIFSQHGHRANLLARFQKSFEQMLDGSLPSRKTTGRGSKVAKPASVTLDPRILELFIGLGDPTEPDSDFDEALNDLLYFVIDILQFHGERNAYDEIDFDAMVVETYDALRGYYGALKGHGGEREEGAHTILVLDKALHAFPWESLPCMQGLAVSRVPSLACLGRLMRESNASLSSDDGSSGSVTTPGHHVKSESGGTYMLNPSSDLKNTQAYFQASFKSLKGWTGIVNKEPSESQFESALSQSEVLLYFGHGSGAQYIRGKTIRRLNKVKPATFLMGCSSAALNEVGEFESYGPVWNYMMAGCPAVVGTLWDVTDRDIDRFAGRTFEEWGLVKPGTFKAAGGSGGGGGVETGSTGSGHGGQDHGKETAGWSKASLLEAVMRARDVCRFRYLNAAAVVVYGIPVYIDRN